MHIHQLEVAVSCKSIFVPIPALACCAHHQAGGIVIHQYLRSAHAQGAALKQLRGIYLPKSG